MSSFWLNLFKYADSVLTQLSVSPRGKKKTMTEQWKIYQGKGSLIDVTFWLQHPVVPLRATVSFLWQFGNHLPELGRW